jgi:hypothetical protein
MKCETCGEEEFVHQCSPNVAVGYPWHCRNPKTLDAKRQEEFSAALSDLIRVTRSIQGETGPETPSREDHNERI